jgi:universal stress protein E
MSGHKKFIEKEIKKNVRELFNDYDMDDDNLFVDQGEPWKIITDYANEINAECIVIGSMDRKGISGKLIGNTAEKVIHQTKSDLLVISPK